MAPPQASGFVHMHTLLHRGVERMEVLTLECRDLESFVISSFIVWR